MRKLISIAYLGFILLMGMVQGGFFLDKMECTGSGSIALALNTRIQCCESDSDNAGQKGISNPCCIHRWFFIENDIEPEHQIINIFIPQGLKSSASFAELNSVDHHACVVGLEIRPPPRLTQATLCTFRI